MQTISSTSRNSVAQIFLHSLGVVFQFPAVDSCLLIYMWSTEVRRSTAKSGQILEIRQDYVRKQSI